MDSILISVKKMLGIEQDYTHFDSDIILNINSVLAVLNQIGLESPVLEITGNTETWLDLLGDRKDIAFVKTLIYSKVRLLFDPPSSAFVLDAMERQIREFEWRLNTLVGGD